MRRVYYMNPKRKQIVQEALLQMRETRDALGPEIMTRLQLLFKDVDPALLAGTGGSAQHDDVEPDTDGLVPQRPAMEPVDRRKNLLVVMKFLELKQGDRDVQEKIRMMLAEHPTLH